MAHIFHLFKHFINYFNKNKINFQDFKNIYFLMTKPFSSSFQHHHSSIFFFSLISTQFPLSPHLPHLLPPFISPRQLPHQHQLHQLHHPYPLFINTQNSLSSLPSIHNTAGFSPNQPNTLSPLKSKEPICFIFTFTPLIPQISIWVVLNFKSLLMGMLF